MRPPYAYTPRAPAESVLYQIVRDHFETFHADAARAHDGDGLPRFIEEEFRGHLRCGFLAGSRSAWRVPIVPRNTGGSGALSLRVGDRDRIFVDIQTDEQRSTLGHG